jgi:branched-chain amino acid transport system substrate-binding protein
LRKAGRTERSAVRAALERIEAHDGLVRNYRRPFGPNDHEALDRSQLFMAHFDGDGNLRAVAKR